MRFLLFLAAALISQGALGQSDQDHAAHHPEGASAPSTAPQLTTPPAKPEAPRPAATQMDKQMKAMREMHEKMLTAKTPEERQALMTDHMKAMQDGMSMMGQMSGKPGTSTGDGMSQHEMMVKRMDMMEMMMQMMMDREAARAPATK